MKLLRINLNNKDTNYQKISEKFLTIGGRGLIAILMNEEVRAQCYPLGPENKLIISNGPLAGLGISSAGRISIGAKSPLTGGIKESNSGGTFADSMAKMGLRAIILEGMVKEDKWYFLKIDEEKVEFISADDYIGLGNYATAKKLFKRFGNKYSLITIGQAGEQKLINSGLALTDLHNRPGRMAARGGLGAVMGSKKIKGILLNKKGTYKNYKTDSEKFEAVRKAYHKIINECERIKVLAEYGTASTVMDAQRVGALPTFNFSRGQFDGAENLSGENIYNLIKERGGEGKNTEACMSGCLIRCSNVFPDKKGKEIVAPLEYETLGLIGSNLGISDPDEVAKINYICNDYGLDTIETGGALGVMAEAGLVKFGDAKEFINILKEVPKNKWRGRMVGMGTGITAKFLNVRRSPVVKNQCMSAYDPRAVKGTGVTYATSPMGADHTAGLTIFMPIDHHNKKDQVKISRLMQISRAAYDSLGLCVFLMAATASHPDIIVALLNSLYGLELKPEYINELGKLTISLEKKYNKDARMGKNDDRIPEFFKEETLPPFDLTWDIEDKELDEIFLDL
ncbi:MAG TPA: aldehyde ferredoxin oxidoreductase [Candidatus Atribacteria bacterium]|nr:aldehyde ferredoxin oxidoreductase [Candidatus Atribacteria bacterium]